MIDRSTYVAAAVAFLLVTACTGAPSLRAPEEEPVVIGAIASITHRATASGLLVQPGVPPGDPCGILATVDAETRYLERSRTGTLTRISLTDLAEGDTVEVYVSGPVMESCPLQGRGATIIRRIDD